MAWLGRQSAAAVLSTASEGASQTNPAQLRVNFLWRLAEQQSGDAAASQRQLGHTCSLRAVRLAEESGLVLPRDAERTLCRYCSRLIVGGLNATARLHRRTKRSPGARALLRLVRSEGWAATAAATTKGHILAAPRRVVREKHSYGATSGSLPATELVLTCAACLRGTGVKGLSRRQKRARRAVSAKETAAHSSVATAKELGKALARKALKRKAAERDAATAAAAGLTAGGAAAGGAAAPPPRRRTLLEPNRKKKKKAAAEAPPPRAGSLMSFMSALRR